MLLAWQEGEANENYLSLNEAGNNEQQFRKLLMSILKIWYCSALNTILELLKMQNKTTMLN